MDRPKRPGGVYMEDRTQQMGPTGALPGAIPGGQPAERTLLTGAPAANLGPIPDSMRTAMGAPMRALEMEAVPGSPFAYAPDSTREHLMLLLKSSGQMLGRRMPLNLCLVID